MQPHLKPVFQKGLKHWTLHLLNRSVAARFGLNIVMIGTNPGRISYELIVLDTIGNQYDPPQGEVRDRKSAPKYLAR
jgi:hypothetical protein